MPANPNVFDLIEQLSQSLPLDPAKVAEIMSTRLERDASAASPVLSRFTQPGGAKSSRYKSVELRIPDPVFGSGGGLLEAALASDDGIDSKTIFKRYGLDFQQDVPSPRYPPGLPAYYNYEQPWGTLSLGVTNDDAAKLVSFVMKPKAL